MYRNSAKDTAILGRTSGVVIFFSGISQTCYGYHKLSKLSVCFGNPDEQYQTLTPAGRTISLSKSKAHLIIIINKLYNVHFTESTCMDLYHRYTVYITT